MIFTRAVLMMVFIVVLSMTSCEGISRCIIVNELPTEVEVIYYYDFTLNGGEKGSVTNLIQPNSRFELRYCEYPAEIVRLVLKTNSTVIYDRTNSLLVDDFRKFHSGGGGCSLTEENHELTVSTNL